MKVAGTTWLEELIGLAEAGGPALALAKEIDAEAIEHVDELTAPYGSVIPIDQSQLPIGKEVAEWRSSQFTGALRYDQHHPLFNPNLRQLLHVAFKLAAKKGARYVDLLKANEEVVGRNVTTNLYERHLVPLFLGPAHAAQTEPAAPPHPFAPPSPYPLFLKQKTAPWFSGTAWNLPVNQHRL